MNSRTSIAVIALSLVAGVAAAQTTQAVEWKVSDGGNGHWYQAFAVYGGVSWTEARHLAEAKSGILACGEQASELQFLMTTFSPLNCPSVWVPQHPWLQYTFGPWLGAYQLPGSPEPADGWVWLTGDEFFPNPDWMNNSACGVPEDFIHLYYTSDGKMICNDMPDVAVPDGCGPKNPSYLVEWSADCNGDGIVDYGQIKSGQLADDNANGVPDICELSVTGVVPPSVPSQGGSAITIKGNNFPENPVVLVGGLPATDVVRVSATRITAATPSLLPGMASVKVNSFTLEEALYIRPECGSDLDQNGSVDGGDLAILLLDWGPCYSNAANTQPDDSKPFMLQEQPATEAPQSR